MNEVTCYKKDGRIYFRKKDIPYKRYVMKRMGVKKNTFAGNMISRVYDYYFYGAIEKSIKNITKKSFVLWKSLLKNTLILLLILLKN